MTELSEYVVNDEDREAVEKETSITFNNEEDGLRVYSAQRTVAEKLCSHSDVDVDGINVIEDGDERIISPEAHDEEDIVGVSCRAPLGLLKIQSSPRSNDFPSQVVSEQEEVTHFDQ